MIVQKIIALEESNKNAIILLKEGIFWRAYNRSAMRLCTCLQPYKVNSKYIKKVKEQIYYCGFPAISLDKITQMEKEKGYLINQINEKQIAIKNIPN